MKQNRHSMMAKGIMVLLSLLILVFIFTFAWFIGKDAPAHANGLSVSTSSSVDFDVAIGFSTPDTGGSYYVTDFASAEAFDFENLTIPMTVTLGDNTIINNPISKETGGFNLLQSFKPIDLTGDGIKIYRPSMMPKNVSINYDAKDVSYDITENKQYISFDLYVRSANPEMKVFLDKGSYVVGACEVDDQPIKVLDSMIKNHEVTVGSDTNNGALLKTNIDYRKSTYGSFSEDSVVGAVRIAFTQYKNYAGDISSFFSAPVKKARYEASDYQLDASTRKLWIPRPDIYLQDQDASSPNEWVLMTKADGSDFQNNVTFHDENMRRVYAGVASQNITYENAAKLHRYYDDDKINDYAVSQAFQRFSSVDDPLINLENNSEASIISVDSHLSSTLDSETYYYGKCRINLWIEGCDAEARKANDGGSFLFGFDLKGSI